MCFGRSKQGRQGSQSQAYAHPTAAPNTSTPGYVSMGKSGRRGRPNDGSEVAERKRRVRRNAAVVGAM